MYEWLVTQIGANMALGIALGSLATLALLSLAGIFILARRLVGSTPQKFNEKRGDHALEVADSRNIITSPEQSQSRLTLCDSVIIDEARRLVLVRRDDVEHLILIGSAGDMVIEHNIPVEEEAVATVSMLAIAQEAPQESQSEAGAKQDDGVLPIDLDKTATPEIIPQSAYEDLANDDSLSDAPLPESTNELSELSASSDDDLAMASIFPSRQGNFTPHHAEETQVATPPVVPPEAESIVPKPLGDKHEPTTDSMVAKNNTVDPKLPEPPIASYFAGQPRRPVHELEASSVAANTARILPLNPFLQLPLSANTQPTPPSQQNQQNPTPNQPPFSAPSRAPAGTAPATASQKPVSTPATSPTFINSFLGFPLENLSKAGTGRPASMEEEKREGGQAVLQPQTLRAKKTL